MRVQLVAGRRRADAEHGAIAVLTAFLALGLAVLAAFTVDLGYAYTSKQQLQTAADAGALAAAEVYKGHTGSCATLSSDPTLRGQAQTAADLLADQNRPGESGSAIVITCPAAGGLTVTYSTSGSTATFFGAADGPSDKITTSRTAAATIGHVHTAAGPMRPWGICSNVATTSGEVVFVPAKGGATSTQDSSTLCGSDAPPGGWWIAQCTGQSNANGATEATVTSGCATSSYHAVPGQPTTGPADLYTYLTSKCPNGTADDTCLSSDNGNNFHNASDEWQALVGRTFTMPVFCTPASCSHLAATGNGTHGTYAIYRMATVELCGFELQPQPPSTGWPTTGPCATANPRNYHSSDVTSGAGFFLVITALSGGPGPDWTLDQYDAVRLTQ